ncbi:hypothetical protein NL349_28585, partial [Klebsiella pneumoniae]|nr:hypothetical protein [Klebsiella pneumoniae]
EPCSVRRRRQQLLHSDDAPVRAAAQLPDEALQLLPLLLRQLVAEDADGYWVFPTAQGLVHLRDIDNDWADALLGELPAQSMVL